MDEVLPINSPKQNLFESDAVKNLSKKIVAVLGGAHVPGVKNEIYRSQDIDSISTIPPKKPVAKIVGWLIPAAVIALLSYAFSVNIQTGLEQLSAWVL